MANVRLKQTENEKLVGAVLGNESDYKSINMNEHLIDNMIEKERTRKFNSEVEKFEEQLEENNNKYNEAVDTIEYDITKAEIKPMFSRILVKPFRVNPFQKMNIEKGIIIDAGGYTPQTDFNPATGKYEEMKQFISTGYVFEVGPETKYIKEGDVIYYRTDTSVPVPFFKHGLVSLAENQIIAVVAESLTERFNGIDNKESWLDLSELPECLGLTVAERLEAYTILKNNGIKIKKA